MSLSRKVAIASFFGYVLLASQALASSWNWQHPGMHGGNGMLEVSVLTRTHEDWAPNNWKGECSGASRSGTDPTGTRMFQGFAWGAHYGGLFGSTYLFTNAILCTNSDEMNGQGWTINKFDKVLLSVYNHNDQRGSWQQYGDWVPNYYKGECPDGYAITGLAQTPADNSDITTVMCSRISVESPASCSHTNGNLGDDQFGPSVANIYGDYTFDGQDWNYGYYKTSCPADTFVAGIGVLPGEHVPGVLLCCQ